MLVIDRVALISSMVICAIVGCVNRSGRDKEKSFFRLPTVLTHQGPQTQELSKKRQELWVARIRRGDLKTEQYPNTRVCSDHFAGGSPARLFDVSNPDWAPTLNLGYSFGHGDEGSKERYERRMARKRGHAETETAATSDALIVEDNPAAAKNDDGDEAQKKGMKEGWLGRGDNMQKQKLLPQVMP